MNRTNLVVIAHNIRSVYNIGSLLRTADGLGVDRVYISGYSPYPKIVNDSRLPHVSLRASQQIAKTALGAEKTTAWEYSPDIHKLIVELRLNGFAIIALDQTSESSSINSIKNQDKIALLLGSEIGGLDKQLLSEVDTVIEIPMIGKKNSFNVSVAAAMALYHIRYLSDLDRQA